MPLEAVVDYPCKPKRELGGGDLRAGTRLMVGLLRVRAKADAVRAVADGAPADDLTVKVTLPDPAGEPREEALTVRELDARAAALDPHAAACVNCPVNGMRRPFGCALSVGYPIRTSTERWLLDRAQPPDAIGGALLLQAIADHGYDGEPTRGHRAGGKLQAFPGLSRDLPRNPFDKPDLSADELLQPLMPAAGRLAPWQSLHVLLWFGAIAFDGKLPTTSADALALARLEPADRPKRARPSPGPSAADPGVDEVRNLFKLLYVGWARDVDVTLEA